MTSTEPEGGLARRNDPIKPIAVTLPMSPEAARLARGFIREHTTLDCMRHMEADLLVTELICNALVHCPTASELDLAIENTHSQGVKVSLSHQSPGPLESDSHGIGLTLVDRLSRLWGDEYENDRLSIWFVLRKPGTAIPGEDLSDEELASGMALEPRAHSEALVRRHSDLAIGIARRYRGRGIAEEDLRQVAMMALLKAIQRYDPASGELRPYAAATISGELKHLLRDSGWSVRVPRSIQERALAVTHASNDLAQILGRQPTIDELAGHLDLNDEEVIEGMWARLLYAGRSIDKESNTTGLTILEHLRYDDSDLDVEDRLLLGEALATLPERMARIVTLRFIDDKTQAEIAEIVGVSQMHVSRLLARALEELRNYLEGRDTHDPDLVSSLGGASPTRGVPRASGEAAA